VIYLSRQIVRTLPPRNRRLEAATLENWIRRHVRFTRDPIGAELVTGPNELIRLIGLFGSWSEDCDAIACLCFALLQSIGIPTTLVFIATTDESAQDGKIDHVYCEIESEAGDPVIIDPALPPAYKAQIPRLTKRAWIWQR